jgi:23S rRNA pseudouridine1911/1915/1917 synthase
LPADAFELRVLYEDNHLIAVYKPAGTLTQGDSSGEVSLLDRVKHWLAAKYHKPGRVFVGLIHRLDRPASGIVLFAKTSKGASRISAQFRERTVEKWYRARVEGTLDLTRGRLVHFIEHREESPIVVVCDEPSDGAKPASLQYEVLRVERAESVVQVRLETGRKHQIRAQFAHIGHPIVGDHLYGARVGRAGSIALCAVRLGFAHPVTKARIMVELPRELCALTLAP